MTIKNSCPRCGGSGLDPTVRTKMFSGGMARALCIDCGGIGEAGIKERWIAYWTRWDGKQEEPK